MKAVLLAVAFLLGVGTEVRADFGATPRENFHVYLLIGQSNMAGRGKLDKDNRISAERVVKLENNCNWAAANEPLHLDKISAGAGLGASFARALADADPSVTIGLVPCAYGGTSLDEWMPDRYLYKQAVLKTKEAMRRGVLKGILWHQGEADAGNLKKAATYAERLVKMMASLRRDLDAPDVPVVVGELGPYLDEFVRINNSLREWKTVNEQIRLAAKRIPNCHCVSSEGLVETIGDNLHFSTPCLRILGRRYADAIMAVSASSAHVGTGDCEFLDRKVVISDTNRFTCGSGSVASLSPDGKRLFVPYLASSSGFGECHDLTAVADVPLDRPSEAKSFDILKADDGFCGKTVKSTVSYASFLWTGRLRIFLDVNFEMYGYRDWDPETKTVVGEGLFKCRYNERTEDLSPKAIADYLTAKGLTGFNPFKSVSDRCIFQSKPVWRDGVLYGFVNSSSSQPILFRCADGATFEFLGAIPTVCEYECQLAIHKGLFYAVMRGAKADNFWISADGGITWKGCGRVPDGLQRQQMLVWRDKVLIGYSAPDEKPSKVRNGRNNASSLGRGTGPFVV